MTPTLIHTDRHDDGVNAWRMARYVPPPPMRHHATQYIDYTERTAGFTTRRELPHAAGVLIFNLGEPVTVTPANGRPLDLPQGSAFVAGPHMAPALSASTGAQRGIQVSLSMPALRRLLGIPAHHLLDRVERLDALVPTLQCLAADLAAAPTVETRLALLDAALTSRVAATSELAPTIRCALSLLHDRPDIDITDVARTIGWSRKHLANRVRDTVGVGPRTWRRLIRFQRLTALLSARPSSLAETAAAAGYCDQSHMIREFRELAGLTPREHAHRQLPDGGGLIEA